MENKEKILEMYFNNHMKQTQISAQLNVSQQYISKIIKQDERHVLEKDTRKTINANNRKITQLEYQKNYTRKSVKDNSYEQMLAQQKQDAMELSYSNEISDYTFAKWNLSAYHTNKKGNLAINRNLAVSVDVPRTVNMNKKVPSQKYKHQCYMEK